MLFLSDLPVITCFLRAKVWQACQIPNTTFLLSAENLFKQPSTIRDWVFLKRFFADCLVF